MKHMIFFVMVLLVGTAHAQTYIGGSIGYGTNKAPGDIRPLVAASYTYDRDSTASSVFMGQRRGVWGVEAGVFTLPKFYGTGFVSDYAAYKGDGKKHEVTTARISADIGGTALYARAQAYAPTVKGFTAYGFAGVALSLNRSHEYGYYDETQWVENDQRFRTVAPIYGVGVQYAMTPRLSARVEYLQASGIVKNPHTGKRNVEMLSLGLIYTF
jgi:opacity protein-like surface antigen